jgi:hypothetical protein
MAKSIERLKARSMRQQGESVKIIAKSLGVAKSTVSLWVRDIILSVDQMENLKHRIIKGGELGRLKGCLKQKEGRLIRINEGIKKGQATFKSLTSRELFIAGISLYWAEGTKKKRTVAFCNSDPKLVKFMLAWLKISFNIQPDQLKCFVGINQIHKLREKIVTKYWSDCTHIPLSNFTKTSFKKTLSKKVYENYDSHYGTLTIILRRPAQLHYDILGYIEGLYLASEHMPG